MSEYIKISDVMKICKSLYNGYGTTASFNVPVFVDLLRTVAVKFPEPPESEDGVKGNCIKEVNEGEWIEHYNDLFPVESTEECSICHAEQSINGNDDNYCPNCGAKMKKKKR